MRSSWLQFVFVLCAVSTVALRTAAVDSSSPLADAAQRQDTASVRVQIDQHADLNAAQPDGMTALHWAVLHDDRAIVELLLKSGANVKAANRYGVTPLSIACQNGDGDIVRLLLDAGADVNATLAGGETPLMTAARTGKVEPVQLLIAHGTEIDAKERKGQTAIMWAAAEGNTEVVEEFIKAGADFRTPLESGFTPFFFAVREGRIDTARALLKADIDVNEVMHPSKRPKNGAKNGTTALVLAVESAHFELAAMLLEAGADPNDQRSGYTALHRLTWVRKSDSGDDVIAPPVGSGKISSLQLVRELVKHGADVNARLEHGPSGPGKLNRTGSTPFLMAADTADVPYMKLLVELGADPLVTNADHCTPLMAAAGIGTLAPTEEAGTEDEALEATQLAVELGGDVNAVDDNGETAMHGATYKSAPKIVEWLAAHGARDSVWNHRNKYGWTPLLIAKGFRHGNFKPSPETVDALKKIMSPESFAAADAETAKPVDPYAKPKQ